MGEEWKDLEGPGSMVPYRCTTECRLTKPGEPDPGLIAQLRRHSRLSVEIKAQDYPFPLALTQSSGGWKRYSKLSEDIPMMVTDDGPGARYIFWGFGIAAVMVVVSMVTEYLLILFDL
jgi:hypothetical protein